MNDLSAAACSHPAEPQVEALLAEADRHMQAGDAPASLATLQKLRLMVPESPDLLWRVAAAVHAQHGAETALAVLSGDAGAAALGYNLPALASVLIQQAAELQEARVLLARQSILLDHLAAGMSRVQGINDYLGSRVRVAESARQMADGFAALGHEAGARPGSLNHFSVHFISGDPNSPSHDYRVSTLIDALAAQDVPASWTPSSDAAACLAAARTASVVVFWRVALGPDIEPILLACRLARTPVVFDIDDYVFEPKIANRRYIDGLRGVPARDLEMYHWGVQHYRRLLLQADAVTVTTEYLAERVRALGRAADVLPNGLDPDYEAEGRRSGRADDPAPPAAADRKGLTFTIGYTPGSPTHQKDFRQCAAAIARVMAEQPHVMLKVVGSLDLEDFPELAEFYDRVEHDPTLGRPYLRKQMPSFDVHLAPVELDNPFTEAKSELKFFEAAMFGVPTIASGTRPFAAAIENGSTGFVARSEDDWYRSLSALAADPALRRRMGEAARDRSLAAYGAEAIGRRAKSIYVEALRRARAAVNLADASLSVCMFLPRLTRGSGGHAKAISFMRGLAERGHQVWIHFTEPSSDYSGASEIRHAFSLPTSVAISDGEHQLRPVDVAIATFWKTAHQIAAKPELCLVGAYLAQDYEPFFYPMSDDYLGAQQSYHLGLRMISYGPWIKQQIDTLHAAIADELPFFIDKAIFRPTGQPRHPRKIVVFFRPEMARRLTQTTIDGLALFLRGAKEPVEIELFGSFAGGQMPFPCRNREVIAPPQMAALFCEGTVGIAVSSTNPSMVPFEMLGCGLPVIDFDIGDNRINYGTCEGVRLATPTPQGLADMLAEVLDDETLQRRMSAAGPRFIAGFPQESDVMDRFEALLRGYVDEALRRRREPA